MGIDLMECMRAGVTDLRFAAGSARGDADEPGAGPRRTGVFTVLGVFQVDRYVAALMSIAKGSPASRAPTVRIPSKFVLSQPWSMERTSREVAARRSGQDLGPIRVNRFRVPTLPDMYGVISGRHRSFVARDYGDHEIAAQIDGDYDCDPSGFAIQEQSLKREIGGTFLPVSSREPWGSPVAAAEAAIPPDVSHILQALGIRVLAADGMPHLEQAVLRAVQRDEQS
ncbi:MAG: hypothetical protein E6Q40_14555 [Cupriavidus sp.]|nr:MAG: hypothetical protein E6Q40_14555 [Cupriavidus sp.]